MTQNTRDVLSNRLDRVIVHNREREMRISDEALTQSRQYRDSGEAVDKRYESLKGYDGVIVLRLTAPLGGNAWWSGCGDLPTHRRSLCRFACGVRAGVSLRTRYMGDYSVALCRIHEINWPKFSSFELIEKSCPPSAHGIYCKTWPLRVAGCSRVRIARAIAGIFHI